jgi:hypothetical protein
VLVLRLLRVRAFLVTVTALLALLFVSPGALAAPPTLVSVGQTSRHLTATWSLAPGAESRVIEAARSPNTGSDGYFFEENVVHLGTLESAHTSYVSTSQVEAGFYYVHVASFQTGCSTCPVREWSNILTITIPPGPPPPPPPDTTKPSAILGGPFAQRVTKLYVRAQMTEAGTLAARGTVSVPRASKLYRFRPVTKPATANVPAKLRLKLSSGSRRAVKRALNRGRKLRARVTVTATDKAGNATVTKRVIRLKR